MKEIKKIIISDDNELFLIDEVGGVYNFIEGRAKWLGYDSEPEHLENDELEEYFERVK